MSLFPWLFQFLEAACRLGLWPLSPIFFKNDFFCGCTDFSLMVTSGGYCPVVVGGLLTAVTSLAVEHGLRGVWAQ